MDRSRLEAFSDGVFAVAITLLALNLTVARPGGDTLLKQLGTHWPVFVAYLISFFMIGIVWVNHHVLVRGIAVADRTLLFLNLMLLLFVVMIPWATATVAEYLAASLGPHGSYAHRDTQIAMMLYGAVFLGMSAGFGGIFEWTLHGEHMYQRLPADKHWAARARFVGGAVVYVIAIAVAQFNAIAAFVIIALVAVYYIVQHTPDAYQAPVGDDPADPADSGGSGAPNGF
ncbi:MAG TPA: TMEM175 family protein [Streptosporangiaceae bacterium]|nr:TMEM175 family protein [Streptosporangiaceae bacterium]